MKLEIKIILAVAISILLLGAGVLAWMVVHDLRVIFAR